MKIKLDTLDEKIININNVLLFKNKNKNNQAIK